MTKQTITALLVGGGLDPFTIVVEGYPVDIHGVPMIVHRPITRYRPESKGWQVSDIASGTAAGYESSTRHQAIERARERVERFARDIFREPITDMMRRLQAPFIGPRKPCVSFEGAYRLDGTKVGAA